MATCDATPRNRATLRSTTWRAGVAAVEGAVVLGVFFLVSLALFDLGLATFRQNALGTAARAVAREAIIRGEKAAPERLPWGPSTYAATADDNSAIAILAARSLPTMPPGEVRIAVTWLDGNIEEGSRVHVRLDFDHASIVSLFALGETLPLKSETTMRIVN
jgi:hypothetical protein